ncbi:hypothetical protein V6Z12_D06G119700 [Gossypium hirsutum]
MLDLFAGTLNFSPCDLDKFSVFCVYSHFEDKLFMSLSTGERRSYRSWVPMQRQSCKSALVLHCHLVP